MKKIISILLALALILSFAGCKKAENNSSEASLKIVNTIFPQYDFIRAITKGVEGVENKMLLAPGDESHSYSATLEDISAIDSADLFIYVGGESDEWVDEVLKTATPKKTVALTELVETLEESDEGIIAAEEDDEEPVADEHVWSSLKRSEQIIEELANILSEIDSSNAETYRANASSYTEQFKELDTKFETLFSTAKNKTIVIADRNPFRYFCEDYGIKAIAAFSGCSSNNEIPLSVQNELIKAVKENGLSYIYVIESNTNSAYADSIASQTGAEKLVLNSCHNLSKENFESGKTFFELMEENYNTLSSSMT